MAFIFQSRDLFGIVTGTEKKLDSMSVTEQAAWNKKDKTAAVAILSSIDKFHKQEVIHCETSADMWKQLVAYHELHSEECIISLQEKYYSSRLGENDSIAVYVSNLQKLAKQLTDLGETITDRQLISKIKCGLPPSYDSLLLAWESVSLNDQTLNSFQSRLIKREAAIKERAGQTDVQAEKAFYNHSRNSSSS